MTFGKVIQISCCKLQNKRMLVKVSQCFSGAANSLFYNCLHQTVKYSASTIYALSSGIISYNNAYIYRKKHLTVSVF
jgi:hypothetical protein